MKYFFDTEFIEDGKTIELISIGMVSEDGREFYAEVSDAPLETANDWVKENVIPQLWHKQKKKERFNLWSRDGGEGGLIKKSDIAHAIMSFINEDKDPQFYAYYSSYDWVVFCQLFGRMIDLPKEFPMYCMDLKQMMTERDLTKENFNITELLPDENYHSALGDARWNKKLFDIIINLPKD